MLGPAVLAIQHKSTLAVGNAPDFALTVIAHGDDETAVVTPGGFDQSVFVRLNMPVQIAKRVHQKQSSGTGAQEQEIILRRPDQTGGSVRNIVC
jgi:hypothetical protein